MHLMNAIALFAQGNAASDGKQSSPLVTLVPMILIFVIFYFILIRPQQQKAKQQQAMLKTIKSGDKVLTSSGIIATVITVKEDSVSVRSADSKFEITKSAIAEIRERAGEASSAS